jgi:7-cyano-7-deazaguanine synthase in queuosine biosynthesis
MTRIDNAIQMIREVKGMLNDSQDEVFVKLGIIEEDLLAMDGYCYLCYETKDVNEHGRCQQCQKKTDAFRRVLLELEEK